MPRSICIIQARLGSKRFPNKILADIAGHPMIWHVVERAKRIHGIEEVVVATVESDWPSIRRAVGDDKLVILVWPLPEDDVLRRYVWTAKNRDAEVVMRVTADCPLLDPRESRAVLAALGSFDYVTNRGPATDGLDTEVMTADALYRADAEATDPYDREHVTPYLYGGHGFKCSQYISAKTTGGEKWSVDTPEDLELVRQRMTEGA